MGMHTCAYTHMHPHTWDEEEDHHAQGSVICCTEMFPYFVIGGASWTEITQALPWNQPFRVEKNRKRRGQKQKRLKGFPTTSLVIGENANQNHKEAPLHTP